MIINDHLYFVVPLDRDDGSTYAHVHILPISVAAYDAHFQLLIRAYQMMADSGYLAFRSAKRFVRAAAATMTPPDSNADMVAGPLLNEIERLATVVVATSSGWDTLPLSQAISQNLLEPGDGDEAVSAACFFTAAWHVPTRRVRASLLDVGTKLWGAHTSSSPPTAPNVGPQTSTATANTGATAAPIPARAAPNTTEIIINARRT